MLSIIDKEIDDSITEQLKRFENLKQKLEESPELQKQMTNNLDKLRRQSRLIHSDILKQLIDKMELLIIDDQDITNALGYKMYIEHLISLVQHIWSLVAYAVSDWTSEGLVCASFGEMQLTYFDIYIKVSSGALRWQSSWYTFMSISQTLCNKLQENTEQKVSRTYEGLHFTKQKQIWCIIDAYE